MIDFFCVSLASRKSSRPCASLGPTTSSAPAVKWCHCSFQISPNPKCLSTCCCFLCALSGGFCLRSFQFQIRIRCCSSAAAEAAGHDLPGRTINHPVFRRRQPVAHSDKTTEGYDKCETGGIMLPCLPARLVARKASARMEPRRVGRKKAKLVQPPSSADFNLLLPRRLGFFFFIFLFWPQKRTCRASAGHELCFCALRKASAIRPAPRLARVFTKRSRAPRILH